MMNKSVKKQLLPKKQSAERGKKLIRRYTKKRIKRVDVYEVWDAYLGIIKNDLIFGKDVEAMSNVGSFAIEKNKVSKSVLIARTKGYSVRNGVFLPINNLNLNNMNYVFKVNFFPGKSMVEGVKFYPCKDLKLKVETAARAGKDYRECRSKN